MERCRHAPGRAAAWVRAALVAAGAVVALALGTGAGRAQDAPVAPGHLAETGLYAADGAIDPANRLFSPQYPLWTDGAAKARWIQLPPGTTIDVSDADAWTFPVGTKLWKQFAWSGRNVETRFSWRASAERWVFATYVWNDAQDDAVLAPARGIADVVDVGARRRHTIPSAADCAACHGAKPVLGFDALQLSDDRDPLAPHGEPPPPGAVTLATLVAEDLLTPRRPEWVRSPPRIRTADPLERAALGYLTGNCGGCHDARGPLARLGLVLRHDVAAAADAQEPALLTAVGVAGDFVVPGVAVEESRRVAPGAPEKSAIVARMRSRRPSSQMPPLGTVVQDELAIALVERWIAGLAPAASAP